MKRTHKTKASAKPCREQDNIGKNLVNICKGLRPRSAGGLRTATGYRLLVSSATPLRPLATIRVKGKPIHLFASKTKLWTMRGELGPDSVGIRHLSPELSGEAVCALGGEGRATVMLEDSSTGEATALSLSFDASGAPRREAWPEEYPSLRLSATGAGSYSATSAPRTLSKDFPTSGVLSSADIEGLGADLTEAYCRCADDALGAGAYVQPALVRYRLLDAQGRRIFESMPVLLSRDCRGVSEPGEAVERAVSADGTVAASTLTLDAWQPQLTIPRGFAESARGAAAVELLVGPQFHTLLPAAEATATAVQRGTERAVRVSLGGRRAGLTLQTEEASRSRLATVLARLDELETCVARVALGSLPAASDYSLVPGPSGRAAGAEESAAKAQKTLGTAPRRDELPLLMFPNRIWGRAVASDAGACAWANLRALRFGAYRPGQMAVSRDTAESATRWRMGVCVRFADGREQVAAEEDGEGGAPLRLSPVLSYPAADAVEMRVQMVRGTSTFDRTFPLTPDPTGRMALYVSPGFAAIDLSQGEMKLFEPEKTVQTEHSFPDAVAFVRPEVPLEALSVLRTGASSPILAIASTPAGNQAWDFGRHRFVAAGADGAYSIATDLSRHSVRKILDEGIACAEALAPAGPHGTFLLAGPGRLFNISPTGSVAGRPGRSEGPFLEYFPEPDTLLTGPDTAMDLATDTEYSFASGAGMPVRSVRGLNMPVFADGEGALMLFAPDAGSGERVSIDWQAVLDASEERPRMLEIDAAGSRADIYVDVRQDRLAAADEDSPQVEGCMVHGALRGPLRIPLLGRRATYGRCRLRIHGTVSADFILRSITLIHK